MDNNSQTLDEEIQIIARDGHVVRNEFRGNSNTTHACLLVHGLTGDRHENGLFDDLKVTLEVAGYAVLRIDLRGHGKSNHPLNRSSLHGMIDDTRTAYRALATRYESINMLGLSLGGAITNILADELQPHSIVLLNPVTSFRAALLAATRKSKRPPENLKNQPSTTFILQALASDLKKASSSGIATLVLHGGDDIIIPIASSRHYAASRKHVEFEVMDGFGHALHTHSTYVANRSTSWLLGTTMSTQEPK